MTESTELTTEQVLAFMAANPNALRLASAQSAEGLVNGPAMQAIVDQLSAEIAASHDSVATTPGQPRLAGQEGTSQSLALIVSAIMIARTRVSARLVALSPATDPSAGPTGVSPDAAAPEDAGQIADA